MEEKLLERNDFQEARERIAVGVHRTPTLTSTGLGQRLGVDLRLKAELFQKTGSFKVRGVLNRLRAMPDAAANGLVSMSAGNHAAALAYGAAATGSVATIVMPSGAMPSKIEATRGYGGEVVLTDGDLMEKVGELERERGLTLIHPYDDLLIMAGHGTIGLEVLEEAPDLEALVVPIGGGGLIGGIAAAIKRSRPEVKVYGVEPEAADCMSRSLARGEPVAIGRPATIADGLAAPFAGEHTLRHVQAFVDEVVLVTEEMIAEAMWLIMSRAKLAVEPAGAASVAALVGGRLDLRGARRVVCLLSGGNVDPARLKQIL